MVLLVRRRTLIVLVVGTVVFALAMSVAGYISVNAAGGLDAMERKVLGERVLLAGIVGSLLVFAGLGAALYDTVSLNTLLKRLSGMYALTGAQLQLALRRFGSVGDELWNLYENINALSERKSRRIVAMNSLLTAILARTDRRLLVVNAAGVVYKATEAALEYLGATSSEVEEQPVDSIVSGEAFAETSAAISRGAHSYTITADSETVAVIPVAGDRGLAAYYLYLLGEEAKTPLE
ncbi:MAG: hypothetical protein ACLFM0_00360 [Spirochaetales bacterium]